MQYILNSGNIIRVKDWPTFKVRYAAISNCNIAQTTRRDSRNIYSFILFKNVEEQKYYFRILKKNVI